MFAQIRSDLEDDLRWWLSGQHVGDLGLRAAQLEVRRSPTNKPHDLGHSQYLAAERLNDIQRRWRQLTEVQQAVLRAAFSPEQPSKLEVWGDLASIVLVSPGAAAAHRRYVARCEGRNHLGMREWLERLSHRVRNELGQQKRFDAELVSDLRTEAESLCTDAVRAYEGAKRRKRAA